MKNDIEALMQAGGVDALWVMGSGQHNPAMVYLTGGGHLTNADLFLKCGKKGILFHGPMERDEAALSGLETRSLSNYPFSQILKESDGNLLRAYLVRYKKILQDAGIKSGRVAVYGQVEVGPAFSILNMLAQEIPGLEFLGYQENDILAQAMMTKDADEVERIRHVGQITTQVVARTADFLSAHRAKNGILVRSDGEPLTIGEVKGKINLWLSELGVENPKGTIFAAGRDAGVPHSTGNLTQALCLGKTIIFDIYPCEAGGGYFYDLTRTWCLGYAPDDALELFETVRSVYHRAFSAFKVYESFKKYQQLACELFTKAGHPTIFDTPETENGYVHSLGHGVGLKVHERPGSGVASPPSDVLAPGVVATIEPGLYYPDRGMGVRLEDTFWMAPDGKAQILAPYPHDLILPVR